MKPHSTSESLFAPFQPAHFEQVQPGDYRQLGVLNQSEVVGIRCRSCKNVRWFDHRALLKRLSGQNAYLVSMGSRFVCGTCRNREGNEVLVGRLPR